MSSSPRPSNAQRFVAQSVSPVSVHSCLEQLHEQLIILQVPRGGATIDSSEHASYMYTQDIIFNGNLHARVSKSSARYHTSSRKSNILRTAAITEPPGGWRNTLLRLRARPSRAFGSHGSLCECARAFRCALADVWPRPHHVGGYLTYGRYEDTHEP